MIIQIEYICRVNGSDVTSTTKQIKSVQFCNDLRFNSVLQKINPDSTSETAWVAFRCDEDDTDLIRKLVNDPTHATVTVANNRSTVFATEVDVSGCTDDPYTRKIASYPTSIRPAAYRVGATSLFANL